MLAECSGGSIASSLHCIGGSGGGGDSKSNSKQSGDDKSNQQQQGQHRGSLGSGMKNKWMKAIRALTPSSSSSSSSSQQQQQSTTGRDIIQAASGGTVNCGDLADGASGGDMADPSASAASATARELEK